MTTADKVNLSCRPVTLGMDELNLLQTPCILHWDLNHFVVLKKVSKNKVQIHDPARGARTLTFEETGKHFTGVALELHLTKQFEKKTEKTSLRLSDFWQRASGLKRGLLQILGLSICLQLLSLTSPFYMQLVIDEAVVSSDIELLLLLAMGFALLSAIGILITLLRSWISLYLGNLFSFQLAANLFRHLIYLPADYFSDRHMGDIISRFGSLAPIKEMVTSGAIAVVLDGLMALATLTMIFIYSPTLSVIVILGLVIYALIRLIAYQPLRQLSEEGIVAGSKEQSHFMESIRAVQSIKLFGKETDRISQWQNKYADAMNLGIRLGKLNIGFSTIQTALSSAENILIVYLGASLVIEGSFSIGMLYAFMSFKGQFTGAVTNLINQGIALRMLGLHLERLADIALTPTETGVSSDDGTGKFSYTSSVIKGELALRKINYRYSETDPLLFEEASFHINAGESVAIVGSSGAGKTTLLKIMLGLMSPVEGEVLIDGKDLSQLSLNSYRSQVAAVMQDDQLFSGSLADNISMFNPDTDQEQVEFAARLAHIHEEIMAMPMAYNTLIGDMGSSLSGGQKQRVVLARALFHQPKILFMDEATSHLDINLEKQINHAISKLPMTRVIIAHRPQTIAMAERIFVLHNRKLIERSKKQLFKGAE
jgi:ATP-binding cassette subfamily B protein RaxB